MQDDLGFLRNFFIAHISEYFLSTFLKSLLELFQIFFKFHPIFTQFLYTCSFL